MIIGLFFLLGPFLFYKMYSYFYHPFDCQYKINKKGLYYIAHGKEVFYSFQYVKRAQKYNDFGILYFEQEKLWISKTHYEQIVEEYHCIENPMITKYSVYQFVATLIFSIIISQFVCLEIGYLVIIRHFGFEWIYDQMQWVVILCSLISLGLLVLIHKIKMTKKLSTYVCIAVMGVIGLSWIIGSQVSHYTTIYSKANLFSKPLVLKQNKQTGVVSDYHYSFLFFAKETKTFYASPKTNIKTQWITSDCNLVEYYDQYEIKQAYIATYGDRGNGISYYNTVGSMSGQWQNINYIDESFLLDVTNGNITVTRNGEERVYTSSNIQQWGTIALSLTNNNRTEYVIVLNENCELNQDYLIKEDGTITIVSLTDGKQVPVEMMCITYKTDSEKEQAIQQQKQEQAINIVKKMQDIINADPNLENIDESTNLFKIETSSQDYFEVTRLAYLKLKTMNDGSYTEEGQIQTITVTAGTIEDFYVVVRSRSTVYLGERETGELYEIESGYRIMQSAGGYLISPMSPVIPGNVGLANLNNPLEKDVSDDVNYHYLEG